VALAGSDQGPGAKGEQLPPFLKEFGDDKPRSLPPFLDDFFANTEPAILAKEVRFPSAVGTVTAFWARPDVKQPVPALLVVYDEEPWTDWMKTNTRHFASIGYEVLTVNVQKRRILATRAANDAFTDEPTLAELAAAVRWLRGRPEVAPNRLGIVGWGWSGGQALALASALPVQACVICDAPLPAESALVTGLRQTPILCFFAEKGAISRKSIEEFEKSNNLIQRKVMPGVSPGFMGPPGAKSYDHEAAENAWVAMYNFLEKQVEDARPPAIESPRSVATIADMMRAVNEPAGLRGLVSKGLEQEPTTQKQWERVRANAALIADSGSWLAAQAPPKGAVGHWKEQAEAFAAAAESMARAADRRDYPAARRGLTLLAGQCAACHSEHR
jgi:dienelactone hydrolase